MYSNLKVGDKVGLRSHLGYVVLGYTVTSVNKVRFVIQKDDFIRTFSVKTGLEKLDSNASSNWSSSRYTPEIISEEEALKIQDRNNLRIKINGIWAEIRGFANTKNLMSLKEKIKELERLLVENF